MIRPEKKVNSENLHDLCRARKDIRSVAALARRLGKHRTSLHRAVKHPSKFRSLVASIEKELL